ncbi:MAG: hypothetical protein PUD59_00955 [bacterium]|nr:hypothetical protein [bacterium]
MYQDSLYALQNNNLSVLEATLNTKYNNVLEYMKISVKTLKEYLPYIKNTLSNPYHNVFVEGNNNFINM